MGTEVDKDRVSTSEVKKEKKVKKAKKAKKEKKSKKAKKEKKVKDEVKDELKAETETEVETEVEAKEEIKEAVDEEVKDEEPKEKVEGDGEGGADGDGDGTKRKRKRKRKKKSEASSTAANVADGAEGEDAPKVEVNKLDSLDYTIYVEGIPFEYKDHDIKEFFVRYGLDDILQMRLPTWQDTGRLRGFGHIVFDTTESRNKAIKELSGKNLGRRYISIQEPKPSGSGRGGAGAGKPRDQPDGCKTVFVKNLPYRDVDEDSVKEIFRSCGKIVDGGVRLTRNYETKQLKGFGYIEFKNPEGAYSAVQRAAKGTLLVGGRACYVDYDEGKGPKGSFKTSEGKSWNNEHGEFKDGSDNKRIRRS